MALGVILATVPAVGPDPKTAVPGNARDVGFGFSANSTISPVV